MEFTFCFSLPWLLGEVASAVCAEVGGVIKKRNKQRSRRKLIFRLKIRLLVGATIGRLLLFSAEFRGRARPYRLCLCFLLTFGSMWSSTPTKCAFIEPHRTLKSDKFASVAVFLTPIKEYLKSEHIARLLRNKNHRRTEFLLCGGEY